ncbi:MAG: restriction endonuclease [Bacillota bacterium]
MPTIDISWLWEGTWEAVVTVFKYMWWLFPLALIRPFCEWVLQQLLQERDRRAGLADLDKMDGVRFEEWLANFFRTRGYKAKTTIRSHDIGVDIILERDGQKTVVQAKRWKNNVGVAAIQAIYAGKAHYRADAAMAVTTSHFTAEARTLAKSTGVVLWDRDKLRIELLNDKKRSAARRTQPVSGAKTRQRSSF